MKIHALTMMKRRVIALLTREEMEYLEKLGIDSLFSTGRKLTKLDIISGLIEVAMKLNISAKGVRNKEAFVAHVLKIFGQPADHREFSRLEKKLLIGLRPADSLEPYKDAITENISLCGFKIEVPREGPSFKEKQLVEVTVGDPQKGEGVKALGRIIWVREKSKRSDAIDLGIKLIYIKVDDIKKVAKYFGTPQLARRAP